MYHAAPADGDCQPRLEVGDGSAEVVIRSERLLIAQGEAVDGAGRQAARGSGSFFPAPPV